MPCSFSVRTVFFCGTPPLRAINHLGYSFTSVCITTYIRAACVCVCVLIDLGPYAAQLCPRSFSASCGENKRNTFLFFPFLFSTRFMPPNDSSSSSSSRITCRPLVALTSETRPTYRNTFNVIIQAHRKRRRQLTDRPASGLMRYLYVLDVYITHEAITGLFVNIMSGVQSAMQLCCDDLPQTRLQFSNGDVQIVDLTFRKSHGGDARRISKRSFFFFTSEIDE